MTSVRPFISLLRFDLVDLSIGWNLPASAFCKAGFVDRLDLSMVSQISWTFCFMTFLDLVFSLTDKSISSIASSSIFIRLFISAVWVLLGPLVPISSGYTCVLLVQWCPGAPGSQGVTGAALVV
ncbi:hypothetical protein STEG23_000031 [Scotinomys teguina]